VRDAELLAWVVAWLLILEMSGGGRPGAAAWMSYVRCVFHGQVGGDDG
jgi:hypothetical protein